MKNVEHDRQGNIEELDNVESITGCCRYCGCIKIIHPLIGMSNDDADRIATEECDCTEAKRQRFIKSNKEKAYNAIDVRFGQQAPLRDQLPEGVLTILKASANLIMEMKMDAVQINVDGQLKAKISGTSKGIKVEKSRTGKDVIEVKM